MYTRRSEFGYFETKSSAHLITAAGTFSAAQACSALYSACVYFGPLAAPASCPAAGACANALTQLPAIRKRVAIIASPANFGVAFIPISPRSNSEPEYSASGAPRNASAGNRFVSENLGIIGKPAPCPQDVLIR